MVNTVWLAKVHEILTYGSPVNVRGFDTLELLHDTMIVDMQVPIITNISRKLNYKLMASEALWILEGRDDIFHKVMEKYSDDGVTLAGAYGPKIIYQIPYVVDKLTKDRYTRQAVLTIWEREPAPSKDIPCTVSMQFMIRDDVLSMHVYMRSSDIWLGVPYDIFSFSMVGHVIAVLTNSTPGLLHITAGSRHMYISDTKKELKVTQYASPKLTFISVKDIANFLQTMKGNGKIN